MKNLIDAIAVARQSVDKQLELQNILYQFLEIENDENQNIVRLAIFAVGTGLIFEPNGFKFVQQDREIFFDELFNYIQILRELFPQYPGEDTDDRPEVELPGLSIGGGSSIDDALTAFTTTWSSEKINTAIGDAIANIPAPLPVSFSATVPVSPADRFTWFEPAAIYPQPWRWSQTDGVWLSNSILFNFNSGFTGSAGQNKAIPFFNNTANRIKIDHIFGLLSNTLPGAIAHTATDHYTFKLRHLLGTGAFSTTEYIFPENTQTLAIGAYRRITQTPASLWLPGNTWALRFEANKVGTAINPSISADISAFLKFARP